MSQQRVEHKPALNPPNPNRAAFDRMPASDREQALQEADLLARLAHPCIVRYSSSFVEHGALHIVSSA